MPMSKKWTKKERKILRREGASASPDALARRLRRDPHEVRAALREMEITPAGETPAARGSAPERILFTLFIFLLAAVPLIYSPVTKDNFILPKFILVRTVALAALCVWLAGLAASGEARLRRSPALVVLCLFVLALLPSLLASTNKALSLDELNILLTCILLWFLASSFTADARRLTFATGVIVTVACLEAAYGALQYFGVDPLYHAPDIARLKVFGSLGNPNFLSAYLAACLPLSLTAFMASRRPATAALLLCAVALLAAGILLTGTKGGMLAGAASSLFVIVACVLRRHSLARYRRNVMFLIAAVAVLAAGVALLSFSGRGAFHLPSTLIQSLDARGLSVGKRLLYWKTAFEMIRARPLSGWGLGALRLHYLDHQGSVLARPGSESYIPLAANPIHAHNDYLQLWAEAGLGAVIVFMALVSVISRAGLRKVRSPSETVHAVGFMGGFIAILIDALVDFPLHRPTTAMLFWSFGALIAAAPAEGDGWTTVRLPRAVAAALLAAAIGLFCFSARSSLLRYRADTFFAKGYAAVKAEKWEPAARFYERGLVLYPDEGESQLNLGVAYYKLGQWDEAIRAIERGFFEVRDLNSYVTLADAYDEKGNYAKALPLYRRAIFLNPANTQAMNNLGVCLSKAGRTEEALAQWEKAAATAGGNEDSMTNLAVTYYKLGNRDEARAWAERLLASDAGEANKAKARLILGRLAGKSRSPLILTDD
jgi:O-antigen ligase/Flp pilus assembly protein TadD